MSVEQPETKMDSVKLATEQAQPWWLYLLLCNDGRTYAGIALNVAQRFAQHQAGKGARFTRANKPVKVLAMQPHPSKSAALKAEMQLKRLPRSARLQWASDIAMKDDLV